MVVEYSKLKPHIMPLGGFCEYVIDEEDCISYFFANTGPINLTCVFLMLLVLTGPTKPTSYHTKSVMFIFNLLMENLFSFFL